MHILTDVVIRGTRGTTRLKGVIVDTGATYTVLPLAILNRVGATNLQKSVEVTLADGRKVRASLYLAEIEIDGKSRLEVVASFKNAVPAIGMSTLRGMEQIRYEAQAPRLNPLERFLLKVTFHALRIFAWMVEAMVVLLIVGFLVFLVLLVGGAIVA